MAVTDKVDQHVQDATGYSRSICYAIVQIGTEPNSTIQKLRKILKLDHSTMVRSLDKLEKKGLAVRSRKDPNDSRLVRVNLTLQGEAVFTKILNARRAFLSELTSALTSAELEVMYMLMDKMFPKTVECGDDQHFVCRLCELEACPQDICPVNLAYEDNKEMPFPPFSRRIDSRLN